MKKYINCIIIFLFIIVCLNCNNTQSKTVFERKIDSLKLIIPTAMPTDTFDFYKITKDVWNWEQVDGLVRIDSLFFATYISKSSSYIGWYRVDRIKYFYKFIELSNNAINLIVLKNIGYYAYMYLLSFNKEGECEKSFLLASISKSPIDSEDIKSRIRGDTLVNYRYYVSDEDDGSVKEVRDTTLFDMKTAIKNF